MLNTFNSELANISCEDCVHCEVCREYNSSTVIDSNIYTLKCQHFCSRHSLLKARDVFNYISSIKSRCCTSNPYDCDLYALLGSMEGVFETFRLSSEESLDED